MIWIVRDRRISKEQICKELVEGNAYSYSIYYYEDAAKSAVYPTEKVWKIEITATEV